MNESKLRRELESRLQKPGRAFTYDRKNESLRIENEETGKGIDVALSGIVAKWHVQKDKAIDEVVYYVENALEVMGKEQKVSGSEKKIYPVIRSTSFPIESEDGIRFMTDDHTAETRIFYALDLGNTYRILDEQWIQKEGLEPKEIQEIARFNVRSLPANMKKDTVAGNDFYFLNTNDGYDASRILNEKFLQEMAETVEGDMAVAVPHQDVLIIADIRNETGYDILAQMTMSFFTTGNVPITALSFIYENGKLEPIFILGKNRKMDQ
ncbi:DUF1444 domain-containing protein [Lederbergia citrea]|uniref:UPF0354 protein KHA91_08440 n=1 Tax=Lederbergia citrea TaxID=2833581 RepID=A0A942UQ41_9BACI|nr:DUF1444 domain-containing protein [Lederbergia citrea]MBS4175984.1 DUF1444 domain-containing protein [Lederbergia citrea]MBS4202545.1 DUF1444 domain-containing protein [Lederbergia citrea]MBS4222788.1 DUF1444 domain-containing protein [Lederbergia citrea]